jgi:hypothetical protein
MGLDEAYERACKLSPEIAQAVSKQQETVALADKAAKAKKAAEAAKRVRTGSSGKAPETKSLRDAIRENAVEAA